jgi:hypothetical protein
VNDRHACGPRCVCNHRHVIDEAHLSTFRRQCRKAGCRPNHATLHLLNQQRTTVGRHQVGDALNWA